MSDSPQGPKTTPATAPARQSNLDRQKEALARLVGVALKMLIDLELKLGFVPNEKKAEFTKAKKPFTAPSYQAWYTEAQEVIRQLIPDRLTEFRELYRPEKPRKEITYMTYTISDGLHGIEVSRLGEALFDGQRVMRDKFHTQYTILQSAERRFDSVLFDIRRMLQADLHDSEIDAARELLKNGYLRAAGALTGVVLEAHLAEVAKSHGVTISKKDPTIGDLNDPLKNAGVYDVTTWRLIQRLGDIRNLCSHKKTEEPTKEQVKDLIEGTVKISHEVM
ncbi:hypothetical protein [Stigmatella erecta]|uniref:DUF4145 domain-containing protein n=1 Tax=Stigmatella erecta TaxID=83460 RepID=A0A1I0IVN8_9BACT|nr:hypothetical protein [Stigmatella erecta]SEU01376.1 hypothetical protein SAMN05443639_106320 [Stigmatella erecta]